MPAADKSLFITSLGIFLYIWKKKHLCVFSLLKSCSKRNVGLHLKSTFIIFSFRKLYFNAKVFNWMWTFVSTFKLFSYANPFDMNENLVLKQPRNQADGSNYCEVYYDKSFIKILLFEKNLTLAQENPVYFSFAFWILNQHVRSELNYFLLVAALLIFSTVFYNGKYSLYIFLLRISL